MFYVFLFLPFVLFLTSSVYFNIKKLDESKLYISLTSIFEAIISYIVVVVFFVQGFLDKFIYISLIVILLIILGCVFFYVRKERAEEWDLQLETIKNNLLLFLKTVLPLYVFLTIFRFHTPVIQFLLTIIFTIAIAHIFKLLRKLLADPLKVFLRNLSFEAASKYIWLWLTIAFIIVFNMLFQLPTNTIKISMNLSNNAPFLTFDGYPTDIQNNFSQNEISQYDIENLLDGVIADYYYDNDNLYLYSSLSELVVIDRDTEEIIYDTQFSGSIDFENIEQNTKDELYEFFAFYDNHLLLFDTYGIYEVFTNSTVKISDISSFSSSIYFINNELFVLDLESNLTSKIYRFDSGVMVLSETIVFTNEDYDELVVISQSLFKVENNRYILVEDNEVSFVRLITHSPSYDSINKILYYYQPAYFPSIYDTTEYIKLERSGESIIVNIDDYHNGFPVVAGDRVYFTDPEGESNRVEIFSKDFEVDAIYNHLEVQAFWFGNKLYNSYIANYKSNNNKLEFLQVDSSTKRLVLTIYTLIEDDVAIVFPFYTHYGIAIFIPFILGGCFSFTNYHKTIGVIDFASIYKRKKKTNTKD